jgi:hypothetical protein
LGRLLALGASPDGGRRGRWLLEMLRHQPKLGWLVVFLLSLLVPLGVVLVLAVAWLTAMAMTMALAGGLTLAAGLLR